MITEYCINGDFSFQWGFFILFPNQPGGQTPQPIFTQNGLIDVDSRKDVPFAVKIKTFSNP